MIAEGKVSVDGWQNGVETLLQGKAQEAVRQLSAFVRRHPQSFEGNSYLGAAFNQAGQHQAAVNYLEQAIRLNPRDPQPCYQLGVAYAALDQRDAAISQFQKTLQLESGHEAARLALAQYSAAAPASLVAPSMATIPAPIPATNGSGVIGGWAQPPAGYKAGLNTLPTSQPDFMRGLTFGLGGMLLSVFLWDAAALWTQWHLGIVAIALGAMVGWSVRKGSGMRGDRRLQSMALGLVCIGFLIGQVLIMDQEATRYLENMGFFVDPVRSFIHTIVFLPRYFMIDPVELGCLVIGCLWSWKITGKAKQPRH